MRELSSVAKAAKLIREDLKNEFPGIKFQVKSKNYSMGDSINIHWNLGPTEKQVQEKVGKYQYGYFNGMEDIYEITNNIEGLPQTKHLFTNRSIKTEEESKMEWSQYTDRFNNDEALINKVWKELCNLMGVEYQGQYTKVYENSTQTISQLVHRIFANSPLMNGYNKIKKTEKDGGLIEDIYVMV